MTDNVTRINSRNSQSARLGLGDDFVDPGDRELAGTHEGVIQEIQRIEEENGTSYRIRTKVRVENKTYQLTRFLPTPRSFKEELKKFGVDMDVTDISQGLDCSALIGRKVIAEVESKPTKNGTTWNWITRMNPL